MRTRNLSSKDQEVSELKKVYEFKKKTCIQHFVLLACWLYACTVYSGSKSEKLHFFVGFCLVRLSACEGPGTGEVNLWEPGYGVFSTRGVAAIGVCEEEAL